MKIPKDLMPGDRLWYSKTEYSTVANMIDATSPYNYRWCVRSKSGHHTMWYTPAGVEVCGDTPPIIRIERIASAKPKTAKVDKDAAYLLRLSKCLSIMPSDPKRLRAIAKRLNGGAL